MNNHLENAIICSAITVALIAAAVFLGFERLVSIPGIILVFSASVMFVLSLGYIASSAAEKITGKDRTTVVMPITSIAAAVISAIVGMIMYKNDHSFMNIMSGFEAELVWFVISVPAAVVAAVQFIRCAIKKESH